MKKLLLGIIFSLIGLQSPIYADFSKIVLEECDIGDKICEEKIYKKYTISKTKACSIKDWKYESPLQASRPNAEVKVYGFSKSSYKKKKTLAYVVNVTYKNDSQETYLYTYDCLSKKPLQIGTFSSFWQKKDTWYMEVIWFTYPNIILDFWWKVDWEAKTLKTSISSYFQNKWIYNLDNNRYYTQDITKYKWYDLLEKKIIEELDTLYEKRKTYSEKVKKDNPDYIDYYNYETSENEWSPQQQILYWLWNGTILSIDNYRWGQADIELQWMCDFGWQCGDRIGKARIDFLKKTISSQ